MKWSQMLMIFLLILAQISFVFGGTSYEIQILPATRYLFREINTPIKKDDIKSLQLNSHSHVESLTAEAQKIKSSVDPRIFYRIDVLKFYVQDVGKFLVKEANAIPAEKTRIFPGGRYFTVNFEGPGKEIEQIFKRLPEMLKEANVIPLSPVITFFKQSALNSSLEKIQILIKLEDIFFRRGCSIFNEAGELKERFPGNQCHFFDDGTFVSLTDNYVRMFSPGNEILWEVKGNFHHQLNTSLDQKRIFTMTEYNRDENGKKVREEAVMILSREGKILVNKNLNELIETKKKWSVAPFGKSGVSKEEVSHLNSIYEIPPNSSPLSYLKAGNIIINSLHLGAIILDPELKKELNTIKFPESVGHMVHDVQVTPEGKIIYFNNSLKNFPDKSAPEMFDPITKQSTALVSDETMKFISHACGSVQIVNKDLLMYAGNFTGPIFIDRKSGNRIAHPSGIKLIPENNNPTFMIKLESFSSFFQHREQTRQ